MRIAFLNPSGTIGGAERVLLDLLRGIRALEPDWELFVIVAGEGDLDEEVTKLGVTCAIVPFPVGVTLLGDADVGGRSGQKPHKARIVVALPSVVRYVAQLRRILSQYRPAVVHTNGLKMHALGALAKPAGCSVVWHMHDYASSRPVMAPVLRFLSPRCALGIANSHSVAADLRAICGIRIPIRTIMNGVDLMAFRPEGPTMDLKENREDAPSDPVAVKFGLVATMAPWKGHSVFLRAVALVHRSVPIAAYIIGGPIYATSTEQENLGSLKEMATSLGVSDRVFFTGYVRDVASAMRALDVIVHASTRPEPFGLVIVEAMATGRPVIVSPLGGAAEIVAEGSFAACANPGDAVSLAAQITRLALDADLRQSMGKSARAEAERRFDARAFSKSFVEAYKALAPLHN